MDVEQPGPESFFIAVVLTIVSSDAPSDDPLYDESLLLIRTRSLEWARRRARMYALDSETSYHNVYGEQISWRFQELLDVVPILSASLEDGTEIYTREVHDYTAYHTYVPLLGTNAGSPHFDDR